MAILRRDCALSIVELLIVVAIVGAICSIAVPILSGSRAKVIESRLASDVDTVNYAISIFRSKSGSLKNISDPNQILQRIKNHEAKSDGVVSFLGSPDHLIDLRLTAQLQSPVEASSDQVRAVWNPRVNRFVLATEGWGVKAFVIEAD